MPDENGRINAIVPGDLKAELRSILALERKTFTAWLIEQMQRAVDERNEA